MDFDDFLDMLTTHRRKGDATPYEFASILLFFPSVSFLIVLFVMPSRLLWLFVLIGIVLTIPYISIRVRTIGLLRFFARVMLGAAITMFITAVFLWLMNHTVISWLLGIIGVLALVVSILSFIKASRERNNYNRSNRRRYRW